MKRAILAMTILAACATTERGASHVSAKVLSVQPNKKELISDALVAVKCPDGQTRELGRTGSDGTLSTDVSVAPRLECTVIVSRNGYRAATVPVLEVCRQSEFGPCTSMDITAVLQPSGSAGDVR
jgi:hypothetical protein